MDYTEFVINNMNNHQIQFCGNEPPENPQIGQMFYNTEKQSMFVRSQDNDWCLCDINENTKLFETTILLRECFCVTITLYEDKSIQIVDDHGIQLANNFDEVIYFLQNNLEPDRYLTLEKELYNQIT